MVSLFQTVITCPSVNYLAIGQGYLRNLLVYFNLFIFFCYFIYLFYILSFLFLLLVKFSIRRTKVIAESWKHNSIATAKSEGEIDMCAYNHTGLAATLG